MRTGNPTLNDKIFDIATEKSILKARQNQIGRLETMTISGTVNKSFILIAILFAAASFSWDKTSKLESSPSTWLWGSAITGFILAMITVFKKDWSPITAPFYAAAEGILLGSISVVFEMQFPGIVMQAVMGTIGTFIGLLFAYKSGIIKATENFKLGIFAATAGVGLIYLLSMVLGFFGMTIPFIHESGIVGIGFSVVVVIIAALNLVLDFDFIENGERKGAPKFMEWYSAFALLVTLVWLYLEILRLLSKLNKR